MDNSGIVQWLEDGIPLAKWVDNVVDYLNQFSVVFDAIKAVLSWVILRFETLFFFFPEWLLIILFAAIGYWSMKKWWLPVFIIVGLGLIWNLDLWTEMVYTLSLVLTAGFVSIILGIPIGILAARYQSLKSGITPVLDFMQTMPAFVYLIPAIFFFGIGEVPGVIASVVFAMPPTIRLTILGIEQVPSELIEAANAFGSTNNQKLFQIQLPLARKTIMAGVNQSIMLALSMVVIASMIGAQGLGRSILFALNQNEVGAGFEAGLAIVILAILLDRISQGFGNKQKQNI